MCLLTIILLVVGLVYPVPQFSQTGGLLSLALTRNGTALISGGEGIATITSTIHARREFVANSSLPGTFFGPQLNQRAKAEGAVRYTSHTEYWDDNCGCMATKTAVYFTTLRTTRTLRPTVTLPTNRPPASTPTGVSGSSADSDYDKSNNPDAGDFVGLWLGVMGGCLQRQSGVLVCTGSAFSPNFAEIYEQVELPQNITALLPNGTDGAPAGILMGVSDLAAVIELLHEVDSALLLDCLFRRRRGTIRGFSIPVGHPVCSWPVGHARHRQRSDYARSTTVSFAFGKSYTILIYI